MKMCHRRWKAWGASLGLLLTTAAGCSKAPAPTPPASAADPQLTDSRISAIQNDPKMSPAQKEQAIATLKSRQAGASAPAPR